jgi:hypothetical protein
MMGVGGRMSGRQVAYFEQFAADPAAVVRDIDRLRGVPMPRERVNTVVVSAENLIGYPTLPKHLATLSDRFDISVIAYVRRQDDFLASAWQQWFCKVHADLWAWTLRAVRRHGHWFAQLAPWLEAFGRDRVTVRLYPPPGHGDAVRDFFEASRLPTDALASMGNARVEANPSFGSAVQHLIEGNTALFKSHTDNEFFDALYALLGDAANRQPGEHLYSAEQRAAIMEHYEAGNESLRQAFFAAQPAPLFPLATEERPQSPASARRPVTVEQLREAVDVLTQMVFETYKSTRPLA